MKIVEEFLKTEECVLMLQEVGVKVGFQGPSLAHSMLIYHHYQQLVSKEIKFDSVSLAAAILCLIAKLDDVDVKPEDVISVFYHLRLSKEEAEAGKQLEKEKMELVKKNVAKLQLFICKLFGYNFDHEIAHKHLLAYCCSFQHLPEVKEKWHYFVNFTWKVIHSFYLSERCIQYSASEIAVGCIDVGLRAVKLQFVRESESWKQIVTKLMDEDKLCNLVDDLILVCDLATCNVEGRRSPSSIVPESANCTEYRSPC